jgi:hypothetical protein
VSDQYSYKRAAGRKLVQLPLVIVSENSDGTYSWPSNLLGQRVWYKIHTPQDVPPAYLNPPRHRGREGE